MMTHEIIKHPGESVELILSNHGATGFSIQWEISDETIASVERLENIVTSHPEAGSSIKTKYVIHLKKKGKVSVHFFSSRIWEENGPKKTLEFINIKVQ